MPDNGTQSNVTQSADLAGAMQAMLAQLITKALGAQALTKDGKPLREVCYMQLPTGRPIDPRMYASPWTPAGGTAIADLNDLGQLSSSASGGTSGSTGGTDATVAQIQLAASMQAAYHTARLVDQRMLVTTDGSYEPFEGSELVSDAYKGVILRAQGIPADPPPPSVQAEIDQARKLLWLPRPDGTISGRKTPDYQQYQQLASAWASAKAAYAAGYAAAQKDPILGAAWPTTSASLQQNVDNSWDDWRSAGADDIEKALDTLDAVGGSIGAYYVAQAREVFKAWNLGLAGGVAVTTPYAEVSPTTWYDPRDSENGFEKIQVSSSSSSFSSSQSATDTSSSWYKGQSAGTTGGAAGMVFGVTFGADVSHTDYSGSQAAGASGGTASSFSDQMSSVSISYEFGLCTIDRPYMLSELFLIDGWYLPDEPKNAVSDGTLSGAVAGQEADQQHPDQQSHLLPMVTTQFLVVRNVTITADGWGTAGDEMSNWCTQQQSQEQSESTSVQGGVGYLSFGGYVNHDNADWSGSDSGSYASARSWNFSGNAQHGTLTINGCQIVGWVGEILPASPRVDGTTQVKDTGNVPAGTSVTGG